MVHAAQSPLLVPGIIAASLVSYVALGWVILQGFRWLRRRAELARQRAFDGLKIYSAPAPGLVAVRFHTYYGVLVFVIQSEHQFWAPSNDAMEALRRLHYFNLVWGHFAYGALLIPLVSFVNFLAQRRSIRKQASAMLF